MGSTYLPAGAEQSIKIKAFSYSISEALQRKIPTSNNTSQLHRRCIAQCAPKKQHFVNQILPEILILWSRVFISSRKQLNTMLDKGADVRIFLLRFGQQSLHFASAIGQPTVVTGGTLAYGGHVRVEGLREYTDLTGL